MDDDDDVRADPAALAARAAALAVLAWIFVRLASARLGAYDVPLLDTVNLVFHEAGHVLFMPFGAFLTSLGGSLTQVLIPLACAVALFRKGDRFGAAVGVWWAGENLVDLAPYVADARALQLVLLGGHTGAEVEGHDWEAILGALGWLPYDVTLGHAFRRVGLLVMLGAMGWAGWTLRAQYAIVKASRA